MTAPLEIPVRLADRPLDAERSPQLLLPHHPLVVGIFRIDQQGDGTVREEEGRLAAWKVEDFCLVLEQGGIEVDVYPFPDERLSCGGIEFFDLLSGNDALVVPARSSEDGQRRQGQGGNESKIRHDFLLLVRPSRGRTVFPSLQERSEEKDRGYLVLTGKSHA